MVVLWWPHNTETSLRKTYKIGVSLRSRIVTTVPDSTSLKFMVVGQISRRDQKSDDQRYAVVYVDFTNTRSRKCGEDDFEQWYARTREQECLMGHKVRVVF